MNSDNVRNRVFRGGGWAYDARYARVAYRVRYAPSDRGDDLGFRLSRIVNPLQQLAEEAGSER